MVRRETAFATHPQWNDMAFLFGYCHPQEVDQNLLYILFQMEVEQRLCGRHQALCHRNLVNGELSQSLELDQIFSHMQMRLEAHRF